MTDTSHSAEEDDKYDLVIEGTGLTESILAAAASWAGKKVLHIDKNDFYGSHWAALSLNEIDEWARDNAGSNSSPYSSVKLHRLPVSTLFHPSSLQSSRAYALDLSPHLLYCSSDLVSCLANTRLSQYLEFKALERIYIFQQSRGNGTTLQKVPSSREDVFMSSLSLQEKRKLMKFLTYATGLESVDDLSGTIDDLLSSSEYNLPLDLRNTIQYATALSPTPEMSTADAMRAIRRHLTGFGVYGAFPIIVPLHGGGGEISQAFCRAAAVKGTTYILSRDIRRISTDNTNEYPIIVDLDVAKTEDLPSVRCKNVVRLARRSLSDCVEITRTITVVEGIFESLFVSETQSSDAALIVIPPGTVRQEQRMPIQMIVHGCGIGECPVGQWVIYCSTHASGDNAVEDLNFAQKLIIQQLSGRTEDVEPLLQLSFKYLAPKNNDPQPRSADGVMYVNPPSQSKDYDDAYQEAKRLFVELFGEDEEFLMRDETDDRDTDDE